MTECTYVYTPIRVATWRHTFPDHTSITCDDHHADPDRGGGLCGKMGCICEPITPVKTWEESMPDDWCLWCTTQRMEHECEGCIDDEEEL